MTGPRRKAACRAAGRGRSPVFATPEAGAAGSDSNKLSTDWSTPGAGKDFALGGPDMVAAKGLGRENEPR